MSWHNSHYSPLITKLSIVRHENRRETCQTSFDIDDSHESRPRWPMHTSRDWAKGSDFTYRSSLTVVLTHSKHRPNGCLSRERSDATTYGTWVVKNRSKLSKIKHEFILSLYESKRLGTHIFSAINACSGTVVQEYQIQCQPINDPIDHGSFSNAAWLGYCTQNLCPTGTGYWY